ncbi:2Fe-2S iron-sulfur cluster-binding protein [Lignipirellula cremea]|uniref:2Fe-2S ferredoxin-type domain-containing protein n=1 Tax=Lignipirellula cremea TaxID=2528010 RepID=A0A518DR20_9BACT|nr:2Fe-2S iron-sulfur cluster-binding protein [Lignipirellula cremea]QDU94283.1 hypothetical protein Pla8534_20720 [Lignipirellula cremea]
MPIVKFINEKKEIEVPEGANLRKEALKAGVNLYQGINGWGASINKYVNCWGLGMCGSCHVLIKKGMENTNDMTMMENVRLKMTPDPIAMASYLGNEKEMRLACCCQVKGDIEVETGPETNLFGENFFS